MDRDDRDTGAWGVRRPCAFFDRGLREAPACCGTRLVVERGLGCVRNRRSRRGWRRDRPYRHCSGRRAWSPTPRCPLAGGRVALRLDSRIGRSRLHRRFGRRPSGIRCQCPVAQNATADRRRRACPFLQVFHGWNENRLDGARCIARCRRRTVFLRTAS